LKDKSNSLKEEEYVLIPTPVDYEQFMKMQYSNDFTNIKSLDNNKIPNNLQNKLSAGLIDNKIFNFNNLNPSFDINSIRNLTSFQNLNNDIYNQLNNGDEQKFLIEYANKISGQSKTQDPKLPNEYFLPNFPNNENNQKIINNSGEEKNSQEENFETQTNLNFIEKKSESPIKNTKELTSGKLFFKNRSAKIYENAGRSISKIF
jgi:hypothetical protein